MKALYALVGMQFRGEDGRLVARLKPGEPLTLIRELTNQHDPNAVQVWAQNRHVGYIKATQVRPLARRLDEQIAKCGLPAKAVVLPGTLRVDGGRWPMVEVEEREPR